MAKHRTADVPLDDTDECLVTEKVLLERVPLDRSTVWRMVRDGKFPRPIQLTPGRKAWRWSAVLQWLDEREASPAERRPYFKKRDMNQQEAGR